MCEDKETCPWVSRVSKRRWVRSLPCVSLDPTIQNNPHDFGDCKSSFFTTLICLSSETPWLPDVRHLSSNDPMVEVILGLLSCAYLWIQQLSVPALDLMVLYYPFISSPLACYPVCLDVGFQWSRSTLYS
jgi:hypothetical protein